MAFALPAPGTADPPPHPIVLPPVFVVRSPLPVARSSKLPQKITGAFAQIASSVAAQARTGAIRRHKTINGHFILENCLRNEGPNNRCEINLIGVCRLATSILC